jgi:hypothetical protein
MDKIYLFIEKISKVYAIGYIIILHVIGIGIIGVSELDFSKPIADIILSYIGIILVFLLCDLCFLIPSTFLIAVGTIISFLMTVSVPVFLFLSLFQILGAEISVLDYGFLKSLLFCIIATPFGFMNLLSLKVLGI